MNTAKAEPVPVQDKRSDEKDRFEIITFAVILTNTVNINGVSCKLSLTEEDSNHEKSMALIVAEETKQCHQAVKQRVMMLKYGVSSTRLEIAKY